MLDKPHISVVPEIDAGAAGALLMASVLANPLVHKLLALTEIEPLLNVEAKFTVKEAPTVVIGERPTVDVTPAGNVHV